MKSETARLESATKKKEKKSLEIGWFRANCRFKSPMLQLHKEILDFCDFLSPTAEEQVSRNAAVESVSDVIKYIWHDCKVEVFGSFKTGLFLPSSDVDVRRSILLVSYWNRSMVILESRMKTPQMGLYALSKALSQRGVAKKIQVEVFGSFKTGLFLPSSDVDVRRSILLVSYWNRSVIAKARVPIIKFVEKRSGISFDVRLDISKFMFY
ncbi:putative polynucleotide adenylyltransferase [Helianthus anomalus]